MKDKLQNNFLDYILLQNTSPFFYYKNFNFYQLRDQNSISIILLLLICVFTQDSHIQLGKCLLIESCCSDFLNEDM